ncbi:hypothetical protein LR48_Vigan743s000400 [Vigna angularis]|uniref:Uncharacterized protein n=1 Tax=Phaseolus angularis TaxID=3914 RepID=A0A0L9TGQ3_PHAAN|nr:hypothetical protein LR48_Vigan743s000400 [Vigna angularis]
MTGVSCNVIEEGRKARRQQLNLKKKSSHISRSITVQQKERGDGAGRVKEDESGGS